MTKMFETGMSALVLKICSEYAKSLGLNFPPCTQQEINAICEWVDKHTVKDMAISQDGYNVTFTFKTENDVIKEFTFTIPKTIDVEELAKVLVGSESVVVERLENNSGLRVRLDQSVLDNINSKLTKPATPAAESAVTMLADGTVGTKPLSEIGGGDEKLDKPATPDVVSAVIMNPIGTVMTKPLSEIGEKLYSHVFWIDGDNGSVSGVVSTLEGTPYTENQLYSILEELSPDGSYISFGEAIGGFISNGYALFTEIQFEYVSSTERRLRAVYIYLLSNTGTIVKSELTNPAFRVDSVTEL